MNRSIIILLFTMLCSIATAQTYVCYPCGNSCDTITFTKPGKCPHCQMPLIKKETIKDTTVYNVCFYLQDGVEVLDFAGPLEVFSYAGCNVYTVSKTKDTIHAQGVLKVTPSYSIENAPQADILVFFGGSTGAPSRDPELLKWVQKQAAGSKYLMSVCTGAFILARAGLLEHKTVTTFHLSIDDLKKALPNSTVLSDKRFV